MSYETNYSPCHLSSSNLQLKRKMAYDKKPNSTRPLGFFKLIQIITTVKKSNNYNCKEIKYRYSYALYSSSDT